MPPLILTGASGWFGRVALWEYEQLMGPDALRNDVIACASTQKEIDICSPLGPVMAVPLEDVLKVESISGVLHLAFLTREHISAFGVSRYVYENKRIASLADSLIRSNPGIPIITTSSGAAAPRDQGAVSVEQDPYGVLKKNEEDLWRAYSVDRPAIVFRVYAATGRFMKTPHAFALGDFIASAQSGKQLVVKSNRPVYRSYVNVGCLMRLCWKILMGSNCCGYRQIDACTHTLSLHCLARIISSMWNLPAPVAQIDSMAPPDRYVGDPSDFLALAQEYNLQIPSLQDQIWETSSDICG